MGVTDAPQWLISAFVRSCKGAGASAPAEAIEAVAQSLTERWSQEGRHFHNLKHLIDVLMRVDELAEETHEPELVRLAAWYHGAVFSAEEKASYARRGGEDERASALLAREELTYLGLPQEAVERVAELVTALCRHTAEAEDFDCAVLCDADLAMLAAEPQRYRAYLEDVRAEYAHLPVEEFVRARITILQRLSDRPRLFLSPLGAAWEEPARQNTAAELHRLQKELRRIEADAAADPARSDAVDGRPTDGPGGASGTDRTGGNGAGQDGAGQDGTGEHGAGEHGTGEHGARTNGTDRLGDAVVGETDPVGTAADRVRLSSVLRGGSTARR